MRVPYHAAPGPWLTPGWTRKSEVCGCGGGVPQDGSRIVYPWWGGGGRRRRTIPSLTLFPSPPKSYVEPPRRNNINEAMLPAPCYECFAYHVHSTRPRARLSQAVATRTAPRSLVPEAPPERPTTMRRNGACHIAEDAVRMGDGGEGAKQNKKEARSSGGQRVA